MALSEKQRMLAGLPYQASDPDLQAERAAAEKWLARYNATLGWSAASRWALLAERLGAVGADAEVRPPFYCDYGCNIRLGARVFVNFNCVILDVAEVTIGEGTQIGPAVQIYAADHPRDPAQRRAGWEYGRPVRIGRNVWIGGAAIVLPGIIVGDDAIIGAGAVVTHNVPEGVTVLGNPARPRRDE